MAGEGYTISNNGGSFIIAEDSVNTTDTSLSLVGKYYIGYGKDIAQNSVNLLENFASDTAPANPIEGQLWWHPTSKILYVRSNNAWLGIDAASSYVSILEDDGVTYHPVFVARANGIPVSITSSDVTAWNINASETDYHQYFLNGGTGSVATINAGVNLNTVTASAMKFHGTATTALYADVAELYTSDKEYEAGTVMMMNQAEGTHEVTQTSYAKSNRVLGVVTTDPALLMNSALSGTTAGVALLGRTPCKVTGEVAKGDRIISSDVPGHGQSANAVEEFSYQHVVGRAVESKTNPGEGIIEVVIGVK